MPAELHALTVPVTDDIIDAIVEMRLQKSHIGWHWQLNDDAAARKMLEANDRMIPKAAVEALVETRQSIRAEVRQAVVAFCHELKRAVEERAAEEKRRQQIEQDRRDEQ